MNTSSEFQPNNRFSVIIITLNEAENIANLLDDLCRQTYRAFEVIVVDSNSEDSTVAIAESYQDQLNLRTVVMRNRGISLGRNTGAEHAANERLLFLDADVRIAPDFLDKAQRLLTQRKLLAAGGRIHSTDSSFATRLGIRIFDIGMLLTQYSFPTCTGACIFSTRSVHRFIGGFDAAITLCEDCDYVKRASQTFKFRMLPLFFEFNPRRLKQDGLLKLGYIYLKANILRFFKGELRKGEIDYPFGHYPRKNRCTGTV